MLPNPFTAQKLAEAKMADARRQAQEDRLLASRHRLHSSQALTWSLAAVVASALTLTLLVWL